MASKPARKLQMEPRGELTRSGTTGSPMRPIAGTLKLDAGGAFIPPIDTAGPATWTTALCASDIVLDSATVMDDRSVVSLAADALTVGPGIWLVQMHALLENTSGLANVNCAAAITRAAGVTVDIESGDFIVEFSGRRFAAINLGALIHIEPGDVDGIQFRFLQRTDPNVNQDLEVKGAYIGVYQKVGNANEASTLDH